MMPDGSMKSTSEAESKNRRMTFLWGTVILLGTSFGFAATWLDPKRQLHLMPVAFVICAAGTYLFIHTVSRREKPANLTDARNLPLARRVAEIGPDLKKPLAGFYIHEAGERPQNIQATRYGRNVFITRRALNELSPEVVEFGIAFELADSNIQLWAPMSCGFFLGILSVMLLLKMSSNPKWLGGGGFVFVLMGVFLAVCLAATIPKAVRMVTEKQIEASLRIAPNLNAAREWLTHASIPEFLPGQRNRALACLDHLAKSQS
jgi:hypothetical protein